MVLMTRMFQKYSTKRFQAVWPKWPRRLDRYDYFRPEIDDDAKDLIDR